MPSSSSAPRGVLLAGLGALASLGSLWLPWYTIKLPDTFRDALGSLGSGEATAPGAVANAADPAAGLAGAFAGLFKGLAAVMPEEITANGWTAMSGGDIGLAVAAAFVVLLVLVAGGASSGVRIDRGIAGRLIAFAGLVVAAIAVYHVVSRPGAGAGAFSASVAIKPGIWVALLGGVLMIAGGLMVGRPPSVASVAPAAPTVDAPDADTGFAPPVDTPITPLARDPFAAPALDPFAVPAPEPYAATQDPFAAPEPEPYAAPAAPEPEPYVAHDPYAAPAAPEPEPYTAYAADPQPFEPVVAQAPDDTPVPEWSGFSTPVAEPEPEPAPQPALSAHAAPAPSEPRPAGVSIPPPGWTGAA